MACEDCGETKIAMVAMVPGRDRKPWELCGECWSDGVKPMKLGMFSRAEAIDAAKNGGEAPERKRKAS